MDTPVTFDYFLDTFATSHYQIFIKIAKCPVSKQVPRGSIYQCPDVRGPTCGFPLIFSPITSLELLRSGSICHFLEAFVVLAHIHSQGILARRNESILSLPFISMPRPHLSCLRRCPVHFISQGPHIRCPVRYRFNPLQPLGVQAATASSYSFYYYYYYYYYYLF